MDKNFGLVEDSKRVKKVEPSLIRTVLNRVEELRKGGREIIALSAGEPDFNTPEDIKEATIKAIQQNQTHYCSNRGLEGLRKKIAEKIEQETGVVYDYQKEVLVTSSGAEAINNVMLSLLDEGDEGIVLSPAFVNYENMIKISGGNPVIIHLKPENSFAIDIEEIKKYITPRTKLLVINNPNNPTGAVYDKELLAQLCQLSKQYNFTIVSDEMYSRLTYEGSVFWSISSFPDMKEQAVIINGFSKTYAMTGWRLGYITASEQRINSILKIHQYSTTCSPTFIQIGTAQGMDTEKTKGEVAHMVEQFVLRRSCLMKGLDKIEGISYIIPKGAFYLMADVSKTGLKGMEFAKRLLEEKSVAVIPGLGMGKHCEDFIRISFAASLGNIEKAIIRLEDFVKELAKENRK